MNSTLQRRVSKLEQRQSTMDLSQWSDAELDRFIVLAERDDLTPAEQEELAQFEARLPANMPPLNLTPLPPVI
jgi:hypothetical protein